jgi:hypothetical protein
MKFGVSRQVFIKILIIKFCGNWSSGQYIGPCGQDRQIDILK